MKKIHISLVGGQTLPVYVPIANDNSIAYDDLYLIHSKRTKENANLIKEKINELNNRAKDIILREFEAVNIEQIKTDIDSLKSDFNTDDEIWLNVSGGTKPWSILFYQAFITRANTNCLYLDQNGYLWNLNTGKSSETTTHNVGFRVLFDLHRVKANYTELKSPQKEKDETCLNELLEFRERIRYQEFYNLTKDFKEEDTPKKGRFTEGIPSIVKTGNNQYTCYDGEDQLVLESPHINDIMCNTGWFEYQTALLLSKWEKTKDIIMNVHFKGRGSTGETNEIDIIVRTEKKFLFVECKTSVANPTDLDKFRQVSAQYGGIAVKRILMIAYTPQEPNSYRNNEHEKRIYENHKIVMDKCNRYNIPVFVMNNINRDENSRRQFFKNLESYMDELNEK